MPPARCARGSRLRNREPREEYTKRSRAGGRDAPPRTRRAAIRSSEAAPARPGDIPRRLYCGLVTSRPSNWFRAEEPAFQIAWAAVKKGYCKSGGWRVEG